MMNYCKKLLRAELFSKFGIIVLVALVTAIFFSWPLIKNIQNWGIQDWDNHYVYAQVPRITILKYFQFPLWNPYHCGGMSEIGNPQNIFFSPAFLVILILGPVIGYKFLFLLHLVIGILGMIYLSRYFGLTFKGAYLSALIYCCSGLIILPFVAGMPLFLNIAWIPWLTLIFWKTSTSKNQMANLIIVALLLANMYLFSFHYIVLVLIYVLSLNLVQVLREKNLWLIKRFLIVLGVFLGISAVKLLPNIELMSQFPRPIEVTFESGYSLESLAFSLFSRKQDFDKFKSRLNLNQFFINNFSYNLDENGIYIGLIGGFLLILGIWQSRKIPKSFLSLMGIFLWLSFGFNFPINIFGLVHQLPLLNMIRTPQRYRFFFMIFVALLIGVGFDWLVSKLKKYFRPNLIDWLSSLVIILILIDISFVYRPLLSRTFIVKPIVLPKTLFKQVSVTYPLLGEDRPNKRIFYSPEGGELQAINANNGSGANCVEPIPIPYGKTLTTDVSDYNGEVYTLNKHLVKTDVFSPNYFRFSVDSNILEPDRLVVNQNFDKNWWVLRSNGKIESAQNYNYLLSTLILPNEKFISFYYLPVSFILGAVVSVISLVLTLRYLTRLKK